MYVTPSWKESPNKKILDLPLISWGLFSLYLSCNPYPSSRRREGRTYALINVWWQNWKPRAHRLIVGVAFCKSGWGNRYLPHRARPMLSKSRVADPFPFYYPLARGRERGSGRNLYIHRFVSFPWIHGEPCDLELNKLCYHGDGLYSFSAWGCVHGYIQTGRSNSCILQNHDVVISLPTGYGKSLCYSLLPPIYYDKLRNVI